jgi:hypothetical protein
MEQAINATPTKQMIVSSWPAESGQFTAQQVAILKQRAQQLNALRHSVRRIVAEGRLAYEDIAVIVAAYRGELSAFPAHVLRPTACPFETVPLTDVENGAAQSINPNVDYSKADWTILKRHEGEREKHQWAVADELSIRVDTETQAARIIQLSWSGNAAIYNIEANGGRKRYAQKELEQAIQAAHSAKTEQPKSAETHLPLISSEPARHTPGQGDSFLFGALRLFSSGVHALSPAL